MKQEERTARTRKAIEDAFWDIHVENPKGVTAKAISERAGINRSTFYLYFGGTQEILESIENELLDGWSSCVDEERSASIDDVLTGLRTFAGVNGARMFFLLGPDGDPRFTLMVKEKLAETLGRRLGTPADDEDFRLTVEFLTSGLLAMVKRSFEEHGTVDVDRLSGLMRRWMTEGVVGTLPGDPEKVDEFRRMVSIDGT